MPSNVWGYHETDVVEVRRNHTRSWESAAVVRLTSQRTVVVRINETGQTYEVTMPNRIRRWLKPDTPDAIEAFLRG